MLARSLWFSFSFAISIIIFIISASFGIAEVVVVVAGLVVVVLMAGLEVVVLVAGVVAGLMVVVVIAGLEVVGAFGAAEGVCASATDAIANRTISEFRNVFMPRVWPGAGRNVKPGMAGECNTFYYFRWLSKRRGGSASGS